MAIRKIFAILSIFVTMFVAWPCLAELTEDQAFNLEVTLNKQSLQFQWIIAPKHYLYKKQIALLNLENASLIQANTLPNATMIKDPVLGEYEVYSKHLEFSLPWQSSMGDRFLLRYQGCAKDGFCYLPISKLLTIQGNEVQIEDTTMQEFPVAESANNLAAMLQDRFLPLTLLIFFGLGILLSFTPCVLPMIPIVVNLVVGPKNISSRKALMLACSYVLGMAGCYTVAGIIAGLLGATLQAWLQQPIVLISLSTLLVVLALAQFEIIHISLPHFNSRLHHWTQRQLQGSYIGAFIIGAVSALIVSPCITPPLIGALTYISQHGDPLIGGLALLCLGLGMGVPLIVVAMLSSMILPKAGEWMNVVKTLAGLALLGLAIWLMQRIIPMELAVTLWGGLCIIAALLFKAHKVFKHAKKSTQLLRLCAVLIGLFGLGLILYTAYDNSRFNNKALVHQVLWQKIDTVADLENALEVAKQHHKYTILEFYAYWCTSCKKIEATVLSNPEVVEQLKHFNLLKVDMTNMDPKQKQLLAMFKIYGPPAILFFTPDGAEIHDKRIVGEVHTKHLLQTLQALTNS